MPRRMPALMLMPYCENGTLESFVTETPVEEVGMAMILSFCADVANGLSYLSSRKIVHRDVAARNVCFC